MERTKPDRFYQLQKKALSFFAVFLLSSFLLMPAFAKGEKETAVDRVVRTGTIRCGYFTWPPYMLKDPNTGALSGINYDFMMEIGRLLDLNIEWTEEVSAGTAIAGLDAGRYDVMCASLWPDAARMKHAVLTVPEFYSSVYLAVREDDDRFDDGKMDVNDPAVTLVGMEGDITASLAEQKYPAAKKLILPQMSDSGVLMQSVVSKKADALLVDPGTVADFNKTNGNALKIVPGRPPVQVFPEVLAVSDDVKLKAMLDSALRIIVDSGTAQAFVDKYPSYGYYAPHPDWGKE